jgi:hypothetical protein
MSILSRSVRRCIQHASAPLLSASTSAMRVCTAHMMSKSISRSHSRAYVPRPSALSNMSVSVSSVQQCRRSMATTARVARYEQHGSVEQVIKYV